MAITLWFAIAFMSLIGIAGFTMTPLPLNDVLMTFAICAAAILLTDFPKHWAYHRLGIGD